jgi:hypothetical protein
MMTVSDKTLAAKITTAADAKRPREQVFLAVYSAPNPIGASTRHKRRVSNATR